MQAAGTRNVIAFDTVTATFTIDTNSNPNPLDAGTWTGITVTPITPTL
jgi:hypothetical protein